VTPRRMFIVGIGVCAVAGLPAVARAESNPFVGRWHWDRAASKLPPGEPVPDNMVTAFTRVDPLHVRWHVTVTDAQGQTSVERFDTPANGEFYPISSDTTASFRVNGSTLQATFKGAAGQTDSLACTVSADRQKMTCNGTITGSGGKSSNYVDVYDRR